MKKVFILVVCVVMGVSAFAQKEEKKAIKQVFDMYVKSAKARQADEAIKCLSKSTIDYYSELLNNVARPFRWSPRNTLANAPLNGTTALLYTRPAVGIGFQLMIGFLL